MAVLKPLLPVKARGRKTRFLCRQLDGIRFQTPNRAGFADARILRWLVGL